jgi:hypothetical protein
MRPARRHSPPESAYSAVGFTLQFSVTNVFNLAYGSVMTISGFVAYWLNSAGLDIWPAMAVAALAGGALSSGPSFPFELHWRQSRLWTVNTCQQMLPSR